MLEVSDILLISASLGAAFYCFMLGRRLKKFSNLEKGVGGAVTLLSKQVEELKLALETAEHSAEQSAATLTELSARAESLSERLELHLAASQDLPNIPQAPQTDPVEEAQEKPTDPSHEEINFAFVKSVKEPMFVRHSAGGAN